MKDLSTGRVYISSQNHGYVVDVDKLDTLPAVIHGLFDQKERYAQRIAQVVEQNIYDVGDGARGGGTYIVSRLAERQAARATNTNKDAAALQTDSALLSTLDTQMIAYFQGRQHVPAIEAVLKQAAPRDDAANATKGEVLSGILRDIELAVNESRSN